MPELLVPCFWCKAEHACDVDVIMSITFALVTSLVEWGDVSKIMQSSRLSIGGDEGSSSSTPVSIGLVCSEGLTAGKIQELSVDGTAL